MRSFILGLVAAAALAPAASAATLSLVGSTSGSQVLAGNDLGFNNRSITYITGADKNGTNGLSVSGPARVTFEYLGFEAGNSNYFTGVGGTSFVNGTTAIGTISPSTQILSGLIDFAFGTSAPEWAMGLIDNDGVANPNSANYAMGFLKESDTSYFVFFDDIASGDRDFDDIGVRISVAAVPVPAALPLLAGGLGLLAAFGAKRKRRAA